VTNCPVKGCPGTNFYSHNSHILAARLGVKALRNLKRKPEQWKLDLATEKTTMEKRLEELGYD
jgi:hypothetical protein